MDPVVESGDLTVIVDLVDVPDPGDTRLVPIARLLSSACLVPYQCAAIRLVHPGNRERSVFLHPHWLQEVRQWVGDMSGRTLTSGDGIDVHRAEEHRAVITFHTMRGTVHFKGASAQPFVEALATQLVARHIGGVVATTRAFDDGRGWWLMEHLEGEPLGATCWPVHLAVPAAWIQVQLAVRAHHGNLRMIGVPALDPQALRSAAALALQVAPASGRLGPAAGPVLDHVDDLLAAPMVRDLPSLALHCDAAPRNVLWNGARVAFLDLESVCLGPALVAGELLARRMRDVLSAERVHLLREHAARSTLDALGRVDLAVDLPVLTALTDLCLLAIRRSRIFDVRLDTQDAVRAYTWRQVAGDFVSRLHDWPRRMS